MYADPNHVFAVAVVIPSTTELARFTSVPASEAIGLPDIQSIFVKELEKYGLKLGLERVECPKKVHLTLDEWTPDTGLVTAAFKIRRRQIFDKYEKQINALYS